MKRIVLVFFALFIAFSAFAQDEVINQMDANGKRTGLWKKYHQNNRIRYEGQFVAGKEIGSFKFYSARHSKFPIIVKAFNADGTSKVTFYNVNSGKKESEGLMKGKDREGKWLYFQSDGKHLLIEENYKNGKRDGVYKVFYKTGKPTEISHYKNGKLDGNFKRYSDTNALIEDLNYQNGTMHGALKYFDLKGNLTVEGFYTHGKKTGDWTFYSDGEAVSQKAFQAKSD